MYARLILRTLGGRSVLLALALCAMLPRIAGAQKVLTEVSPMEMTRILTSMGLEVEERKTAESGPDHPLWFELSGYRTGLFLLNDNTDAQLYAGFRNKISNEKVNEWNREHRFMRAYRDKDGEAVLEADLDFTGGVTEANLKAWIKLYRDLLIEYAKFIH